MKTNNDILLQILIKIACKDKPSDTDISKILTKNPSIDRHTFLKSQLLSSYRSFLLEKVIKHSPIKEKEMLEALKMKRTRTLSGVTPVTVLTKPFPCPGRCIYCPDDLKMPKSYLSTEPGAQRALSNKFDPYLQVFNRLVAYNKIGHPTDKIELIVLGGTWSYYPKNYQIWFIKKCFDALNDFNPTLSGYIDKIANQRKCTWKDLNIAQKKNESTKSRCVGLVLETRPDFVNILEIRNLRKFGATKIQVGVQSLDSTVLKVNKRGHGIRETENAFKLLRQAGFKIHVHWMPNLLGSTPKSDIKDYQKLFHDKRFKPDEIKIYPCSLLKDTGLVPYYKKKIWKPYTKRQLMYVLKKCMVLTPRWCRITRMVRDISSADIIAGNKKSNIRQDVELELVKSGAKISEIRYREVRGVKVNLPELDLKVTKYETSVSKEFFLEYVTDKDKIVGFLRLSLPITENPIRELKSSAIIREVHVYGQSLSIGNNEVGKSQHIGIGTKLIEKAKEIAIQHGFNKMSVISSIGTKSYYKKLGFNNGQLYQYQKL